MVKPMLPVLRICTRSAATLSGPQFRLLNPGFDQLAVHALALRVAGNDFRNPFARRLRNARVTFSHKDQTHFPSAKWVKCWVPSSASYKRAIDGRYPSTMTSRRMLKPVFMSSRDIAVEEVVFQGEFKDFHCYFSDIAKCTFVTDDDVANVRASRAAWHVFNACDGAISQYCFRTNDHIFDCAVECGELARYCGLLPGRPSEPAALTAENAPWCNLFHATHFSSTSSGTPHCAVACIFSISIFVSLIHWRSRRKCYHRVFHSGFEAHLQWRKRRYAAHR